MRSRKCIAAYRSPFRREPFRTSPTWGSHDWSIALQKQNNINNGRQAPRSLSLVTSRASETGNEKCNAIRRDSVLPPLLRARMPVPAAGLAICRIGFAECRDRRRVFLQDTPARQVKLGDDCRGIGAPSEREHAYLQTIGCWQHGYMAAWLTPSAQCLAGRASRRTRCP